MDVISEGCARKPYILSRALPGFISYKGFIAYFLEQF